MTLLILVGDTHVNSTVALSPPTFELDDGGVYKPSKPQRWINAKWAEFWDAAAEWKKQAGEAVCIHMGETADDNYHNTSQLITNHPGDQARAALEVLEVMREVSDRLYIVRGTEAHVGLNGGMDESIAKALGAIPDIQGHHAQWVFRGIIDGLRIEAAHHPGTGHARPWTKGADANRLAQMVMAPYVEQEMPVPHLAVRGHNHKPVDSYDNHPTRAIITPSWQLGTSFGYRLGSATPLPIGGMLLLIDKGEIVREKKLYWNWPISKWRAA